MLTIPASSGAPTFTVTSGLTYKPFGPVTGYGAGNGLTDATGLYGDIDCA